MSDDSLANTNLPPQDVLNLIFNSYLNDNTAVDAEDDQVSVLTRIYEYRRINRYFRQAVDTYFKQLFALTGNGLVKPELVRAISDALEYNNSHLVGLFSQHLTSLGSELEKFKYLTALVTEDDDLDLVPLIQFALSDHDGVRANQALVIDYISYWLSPALRLDTSNPFYYFNPRGRRFLETSSKEECSHLFIDITLKSIINVLRYKGTLKHLNLLHTLLMHLSGPANESTRAYFENHFYNSLTQRGLIEFISEVFEQDELTSLDKAQQQNVAQLMIGIVNIFPEDKRTSILQQFIPAYQCTPKESTLPEHTILSLLSALDDDSFTAFMGHRGDGEYLFRNLALRSSTVLMRYIINRLDAHAQLTLLATTIGFGLSYPMNYYKALFEVLNERQIHFLIDKERGTIGTRNHELLIRYYINKVDSADEVPSYVYNELLNKQDCIAILALGYQSAKISYKTFSDRDSISTQTILAFLEHATPEQRKQFIHYGNYALPKLAFANNDADLLRSLMTDVSDELKRELIIQCDPSRPSTIWSAYHDRDEYHLEGYNQDTDISATAEVLYNIFPDDIHLLDNQEYHYFRRGLSTEAQCTIASCHKQAISQLFSGAIDHPQTMEELIDHIEHSGLEETIQAALKCFARDAQRLDTSTIGIDKLYLTTAKTVITQLLVDETPDVKALQSMMDHFERHEHFAQLKRSFAIAAISLLLLTTVTLIVLASISSVGIIPLVAAVGAGIAATTATGTAATYGLFQDHSHKQAIRRQSTAVTPMAP